MSELLAKIAVCTERGKVNQASPYPPDLKGEPGADELVKQALDEGIAPDTILADGLVIGMDAIGQKFSENKVFVPDLLMAAKAMQSGMAHLKPFFASGDAHHKGTFICGTVQGDLHDIGKNLVCMVVEGGGYEVIDAGVDVSAEKFVEAVAEHPGAVVGMSALLTTTMVNMEKTTALIKEKSPGTKVIVGGAPLTEEFAQKIGADGYSADPRGAVTFLSSAL